MESIRIGRSTCLLAGGFEELSRETLSAADVVDSRHPKPALSEGAALLVLETGQSAAARNAPVLAEILGYGRAFNISRWRDECTSVQTITRAIHVALDQAQQRPEQINVICASANCSEDLDRLEWMALQNAFAPCQSLPTVSAPKTMIGESLGAAGALQCAVMIESLHSGMVPAVGMWPFCYGCASVVELGQPPAGGRRACLINALSLDGHASSMVLAV
jgi:3-oxoacyl-(acyl-carrier-protein) synthase